MEGLAVSEADPLPLEHALDLAADIPEYYRGLLGATVADGERPLSELIQDQQDPDADRDGK
jgi:hypothetical protein